jgi:hypothetical protein
MGAPFGACRKEQKDQRFLPKRTKREKEFLYSFASFGKSRISVD